MTEGRRTCLAGRGSRGLASLGLMTTLAVAVTTVPVVRFYQGYWMRLRSLPAAVVRHEHQFGGHWTPVAQVSTWLPRALIATEDRTYYSNMGISFEGIGRALLVDLRTHRFAQGGSTLTQQLARNTLLSPAKVFRRKVSEALLAVMMTAMYSKRQILSMYLNQVYFGSGAYGISAASYRYFGVAPADLTLPEAALLAGLPQDPSRENPLVNFSAAKARQWEVLNSMVQDNVLSRARAQRAYRAPLPLKRPGE